MRLDDGDRLKLPLNSVAEHKNLGHQMFADPTEFLHALKKDYTQIAQSDSDKIFKIDLIVYSQNGSDESGRAAAHIAAEHFDELTVMSQNPFGGQGKTRNQAIKVQDLKVDSDIYSGKSDFAVDNASSAVENAFAIGFVGSTVAAVRAMEGGPKTFKFLVADAAIVVAAEVFNAVRSVKRNEKIHEIENADRTSIQSWLK